MSFISPIPVISKFSDFMATTKYNVDALLTPFYVLFPGYANIIPLKVQDPFNPTYPYDPNWVPTIAYIFKNEYPLLEFDAHAGNVYDSDWATELNDFQNTAIANYAVGYATWFNWVWTRDDNELVAWEVAIIRIT